MGIRSCCSMAEWGYDPVALWRNGDTILLLYDGWSRSWALRAQNPSFRRPLEPPTHRSDSKKTLGHWFFHHLGGGNGSVKSWIIYQQAQALYRWRPNNAAILGLVSLGASTLSPRLTKRSWHQVWTLKHQNWGTFYARSTAAPIFFFPPNGATKGGHQHASRQNISSNGIRRNQQKKTASSRELKTNVSKTPLK